MSIKIHVSINKKLGLPNYGSVGALCTLEIEESNSVLDSAEEFQQRVQRAYELVRESVEEELAHHRPDASAGQSRPEPTQQRQEYRQEYRNDNARSDNSGGNRYIASAKQQNFIASLVKSVKGLSWTTVDKYCTKKFGTNTSQLSPRQASELIDDLQAAKAGRGEIAA